MSTTADKILLLLYNSCRRRSTRVKLALFCVWCLGQLGGYGNVALGYTNLV